MREAGLGPGETLHARADGPGRIVLEVVEHPMVKFFGAGTGMFDRAELERLRDEWDR